MGEGMRTALARELLDGIRAKAALTPRQQYYKTVSQEMRFESDLLWVVIKWMEKYGIEPKLSV